MRRSHQHESGFALLMVFALAAAMAVMMYMEAPRLVFEAQRRKEGLLIERGEQYQRAIQLFFRKHKKYPQNLEEVEKYQDLRFLRKKYKDPLTGKDEWRVVKVDASGQFIDSLVHKKKDPMSGDKDKDKLETHVNAIPTANLGGIPGQDEQNAALKQRASDRPAAVSGVAGSIPGGIPAGMPGGVALPYDPANPNAQGGVPGQSPYPQGQPYPGQPAYPGQASYPGQPGYPGQLGYPGQPGQAVPGQPGAPLPFQIPGQPGMGQVPGQYPGQNPYPGQGQYPGQPGYPGQTPYPGQSSYPGQPGQAGYPGQGQYPGQPGYPGQGQGQYPGQPGYPGQGQYPQTGTSGGFNPNIPPPGGSRTGTSSPTGTPPPGTPPSNVTGMIQQMLTTPRGGVVGTPGGTGVAGTGGIAGIASKAEGAGIKIYNEKSKYKEWEFLYEPQKDKSAQIASGGAGGNQLPGGQPGSDLNKPQNPGFGNQPPFGNGGGLGNSGGFGQPQGPRR